MLTLEKQLNAMSEDVKVAIFQVNPVAEKVGIDSSDFQTMSLVKEAKKLIEYKDNIVLCSYYNEPLNLTVIRLDWRKA